MPIMLSSSESSTLEPKRKHRWVLQLNTVPGGGDAGRIAFCAHTGRRPAIAYNVTELQRLNERFYMAGKPTWTEMPMSFYDYMEGSNSVSQILYSWSTSIYDPITGAMGFKEAYKANGTLAMLDPAGGVAEIWNLFYLWPYSIDWGELSSEDDGIAEVSAVFRYDFAIKGSDISRAAPAAGTV